MMMAVNVRETERGNLVFMDGDLAGCPEAGSFSSGDILVVHGFNRFQYQRFMRQQGNVGGFMDEVNPMAMLEGNGSPPFYDRGGIFLWLEPLILMKGGHLMGKSKNAGYHIEMDPVDETMYTDTDGRAVTNLLIRNWDVVPYNEAWRVIPGEIDELGYENCKWQSFVVEDIDDETGFFSSPTKDGYIKMLFSGQYPPLRPVALTKTRDHVSTELELGANYADRVGARLV